MQFFLFFVFEACVDCLDESMQFFLFFVIAASVDFMDEYMQFLLFFIFAVSVDCMGEYVQFLLFEACVDCLHEYMQFFFFVPGGFSARDYGIAVVRSLSVVVVVATMKYLLKFHSDCFETLSADFLWPS